MKTDGTYVNAPGVLLPVAIRILRKPHPESEPLSQRASLSPLCYLIHAAVSGIREKKKESKTRIYGQHAEDARRSLECCRATITAVVGI